MEIMQTEKEFLSLSRQMWGWMSERNLDALNTLFHEKAKFVHMGATFSKTEELEVLRTGAIQPKEVEFQESSARLFANTAVVLNKIRLVAVVHGDEVTNPFVVTEVYVQEGTSWLLASLAFTRLITP